MDATSRLRGLLGAGADDGEDFWWAVEVVERFAFVESLGYHLADVSFHHEGNYVQYEGPRGSMVFYYNPGSTRTFGITLEFDGVEPESLDSALLRSGHEGCQPPMLPLDRNTVAANFRYWAEALGKVTGIITAAPPVPPDRGSRRRTQRRA